MSSPTSNELTRHYARVIAHTDRIEATGCLISRYSPGSHGYAQAWDGKSVTLAHLLVWRHVHGRPEHGMTVDHTCHNRKCVEITHLRLLPNLDNARRNGVNPDWPVGEGECVNGHSQEHWRPKGPARTKGYCGECRRVRRAGLLEV